MLGIQKIVYAALLARGYLTGDITEETIQQVLKALEELGEVARHVFDGKAIPASELADVVIPLLAIAELQGDDLLVEVLAKVQADVARGRRDTGNKKAR